MKKEIKEKVISYLVKCSGLLGITHNTETLLKELKEKYNISNDYDNELKTLIKKYVVCYFD